MSDPTASTPTVHPNGRHGGSHVRPRRFSTRQRRALAGVGLVILLLLGALIGVGGGSSSGDGLESAASGEVAGASGPSGDDEDGAGDDGDESDDIDDADEDALDATDDSYGFLDGGQNVEEPPVPSGGGAPVELDPVETVDEQCGKILATGAHLLVTPDPVVLEPGDLSDALTIRNCGEGDVDWTALTVPGVALDTAASTLAGGATTQLGYTIDADAYEPGAVDFKIKVSEPGHNTYVDVHAFRPTFGQDIVAGNGQFSAGEDAGGCANHCITKAWLTPNASSANLGFEVKTHTPATIRVWVDTQAPTGNGTPLATSPAGTTQWNTVLAPLQASTQYYLLLRATDANGKTDERSHTFTTTSPVNTVDELAGIDPKCHAQCITQAKLTPGGDFSVQHLDVQSTTPARFQVWVDTEAPSQQNGAPTFDDPELVELSGLEYHDSWQVDLQPLEGSTKYHIIVRAEDTDGEVAHQVGTFTTPPEPTSDVLITFHTLKVLHDGDSSWKNRGELSFAWAVGDTTVGTRGEEKMSDGDSFSFHRSKASYLATGLTDDDFLPNIRVSGSERDADGKVEFCSMGTGAAYEAGSNGDCDAKWNVASSGLVKVGGIDSLTRCSDHGIPDPRGADGCLLLQTLDEGDDYARFQVVVSLHIVD